MSSLFLLVLNHCLQWQTVHAPSVMVTSGCSGFPSTSIFTQLLAFPCYKATSLPEKIPAFVSSFLHEKSKVAVVAITKIFFIQYLFFCFLLKEKEARISSTANHINMQVQMSGKQNKGQLQYIRDWRLQQGIKQILFSENVQGFKFVKFQLHCKQPFLFILVITLKPQKITLIFLYPKNPGYEKNCTTAILGHFIIAHIICHHPHCAGL